MAHFYGEMQGPRGKTSRLGTKNSGMWCHIRGWETGVRVYLEYQDGKDIVSVWRTTGSNGSSYNDELIAEWEVEA